MNMVKGADKLLQKPPRRTNLTRKRAPCSTIILLDLLNKSISKCTPESLAIALSPISLQSTQEAQMNDTLETDF